MQKPCAFRYRHMDSCAKTQKKLLGNKAKLQNRPLAFAVWGFYCAEYFRCGDLRLKAGLLHDPSRGGLVLATALKLLGNLPEAVCTSTGTGSSTSPGCGVWSATRGANTWTSLRP